MYKVVYKYDFIERKRAYKGFEVNKVLKEEFVGEYTSLKEAKYHDNIETEKAYPDGYYEIIKVS